MVVKWTVYIKSVSLGKANRLISQDFHFYLWGVLGTKKKKLHQIFLNMQIKFKFLHAHVTRHPFAYLEVNDNYARLLHWCIWKTLKLSKLFPQDEHIKQLCPESCSQLSSRSPEAIGFTSKTSPSSGLSFAMVNS